jgi:dTDP-glucose 4,6-dehydratase
VRAYATTYGLPVTISNCSNNYGPYQFPEKLIPLMIVNALLGKPLPVYGDGQQVRDWLHVEDHCAAIVAIVERGRSARPTTSAAATSRPTSSWSAGCARCSTRGCRRRRTGPTPGWSPTSSIAPATTAATISTAALIERELGWRPRHDLATGLAATVDWYLAAGAWLAAIRDSDDFRRWLTLNYADRGAGAP